MTSSLHSKAAQVRASGSPTSRSTCQTRTGRTRSSSRQALSPSSATPGSARCSESTACPSSTVGPKPVARTSSRRPAPSASASTSLELRSCCSAESRRLGESQRDVHGRFPSSASLARGSRLSRPTARRRIRRAPPSALDRVFPASRPDDPSTQLIRATTSTSSTGGKQGSEGSCERRRGTSWAIAHRCSRPDGRSPFRCGPARPAGRRVQHVRQVDARLGGALACGARSSSSAVVRREGSTTTTTRSTSRGWHRPSARSSSEGIASACTGVTSPPRSAQQLTRRTYCSRGGRRYRSGLAVVTRL